MSAGRWFMVVVNCSPGVWDGMSKRRMAFAPSKWTYRVCPSSESASLLGSLPTKTGLPTVPVAGSMGVMLLPPAPTLLGTLA
jgi:hypothetical protein